MEAVEKFKSRLDLSGFYTPKHFIRGKFAGYDFVDVRTGEKSPFIRLKGGDGWKKFGAFYFCSETIDKGNMIIDKDLQSDILIVDEVGPLELRGQGFIRCLHQSVENCGGELLVVIRSNLLPDFMRIFNSNHCEIDLLTISEVEAFFNRIASHRIHSSNSSQKALAKV
jgi:iron complex transport system ATP-binding protein